MSLEKLKYSKDWTNPSDFPTVELNEEQVRADMQFLYDEIRDYLNGLTDVLDGLGVATTVQLPDDAAGFRYVRLNADRVLETSTDGAGP